MELHRLFVFRYDVAAAPALLTVTHLRYWESVQMSHGLKVNTTPMGVLALSLLILPSCVIKIIVTSLYFQGTIIIPPLCPLVSCWSCLTVSLPPSLGSTSLYNKANTFHEAGIKNVKWGPKKKRATQRAQHPRIFPHKLISAKNLPCAPWTFHQIYTQGLKSVQFAFLFFTHTGQTLKTC